jgi:hypothetical protein
MGIRKGVGPFAPFRCRLEKRGVWLDAPPVVEWRVSPLCEGTKTKRAVASIKSRSFF